MVYTKHLPLLRQSKCRMVWFGLVQNNEMCDLHKSPGTVTILKTGRNGGLGMQIG